MSRDTDDDLELPALDGESEEEDAAVAHDDLELTDDGGDAFDDAAAGDVIDGAPALGADGPETGLLVDGDEASALDVGVFDVAVGAEEGAGLLDDDTASRGADDDFDTGDEAFHVDAGEEGPLGDDEELREDDLPALDADEDGDVADDELYDRAMLSDEDELRWDDRAWARIDLDEPAPSGGDDPDDSGVLSVPGEDPSQRPRDLTWKRLDETGRVTAVASLPGGILVVALATTDWGRSRLVRISPDGAARIIAEIDAREEDGDACKVAQLRWDAATSRLVVSGNFGVCAFRPA